MAFFSSILFSTLFSSRSFRLSVCHFRRNQTLEGVTFLTVASARQEFVVRRPNRDEIIASTRTRYSLHGILSGSIMPFVLSRPRCLPEILFHLNNSISCVCVCVLVKMYLCRCDRNGERIWWDKQEKETQGNGLMSNTITMNYYLSESLFIFSPSSDANTPHQTTHCNAAKVTETTVIAITQADSPSEIIIICSGHLA